MSTALSRTITLRLTRAFYLRYAADVVVYRNSVDFSRFSSGPLREDFVWWWYHRQPWAFQAMLVTVHDQGLGVPPLVLLEFATAEEACCSSCSGASPEGVLNAFVLERLRA